MTRSFKAPKRKTKFNESRIIVDGIAFRAKSEAGYYATLKQDPTVESFDLQPKYVIVPGFRKCCGVLHPKGLLRCPTCHKKPMMLVRDITYTADFLVRYKGGHTEVVDVKGWEGFRHDTFRLKEKLFERAFPELTLKLVYPPKKAKKVKP